jgi:hypothetical protein
MPDPLRHRLTEALLIPAALVCVVGLVIVHEVYERSRPHA